MQDYFNGTRTVIHDDGSITNVYYEHEPYSEPLTMKQNIAIFGGTLLTVVGFTLLPVAVGAVAGRADRRRMLKDRQKTNKDLFNSMKKS